MGRPNSTLSFSRSTRSSSVSASKPFITQIVPPAATTVVQMALSCAVWNIGIIATARSSPLMRVSTAVPSDSR
jgi:hypothetical protein